MEKYEGEDPGKMLVHLEITDHIAKADQEAVYQGLREFNLARIDDREPKELGIYLRNEQGVVIAGLIGKTHGLWLLIKYLWVDESLRGQQIGSKLLEQAEATARQRNCRYVFLDTFSFQAPGFYLKHGYQKVLTLENYPIEGARYYFNKTL